MWNRFVHKSKKRPNVSFHVWEERINTGSNNNRGTVAINYIECSVGASTSLGEHTGLQETFPLPVPPTSVFDHKINNEPKVVVPSAPAAPAVALPTGGISLVDRLEQLQDIK